jgi:hypothetical protein
MPNQIKLQCRPELLQQWQGDIVRNPAAFAQMLALSPEYLVMLVNDAAAAPLLQQRALAAEFYAGSLGSVAAPCTRDGLPCRLCQQVTQTVAWACTQQCKGDQS